MKTIRLTRGMVALVDDEDFDKVNAFKWLALLGGGVTKKKYYAYRTDCSTGKRVGVFMHRFILGNNGCTDHIDGDGLNNQKKNLRSCNHSQNAMNQNTQRFDHFKGVRFNRKDKRWQAYITKDKKITHLGSFDYSVDAAIAYNEAAKKLFGEFARLNQIPE